MNEVQGLEKIVGELVRGLDETATLAGASAKFDCAEWQRPLSVGATCYITTASYVD